MPPPPATPSGALDRATWLPSSAAPPSPRPRPMSLPPTPRARTPTPAVTPRRRSTAGLPDATLTRVSSRAERLAGALRRGYVSSRVLQPRGGAGVLTELVGPLAPERYMSLPRRSHASARALLTVAVAKEPRDVSRLETFRRSGNVRGTLRELPREPGEGDGAGPSSPWFNCVVGALLEPDMANEALRGAVRTSAQLSMGPNKSATLDRTFQLPEEAYRYDLVRGGDYSQAVAPAPARLWHPPENGNGIGKRKKSFGENANGAVESASDAVKAMNDDVENANGSVKNGSASLMNAQPSVKIEKAAVKNPNGAVPGVNDTSGATKAADGAVTPAKAVEKRPNGSVNKPESVPIVVDDDPPRPQSPPPLSGAPAAATPSVGSAPVPANDLTKIRASPSTAPEEPSSNPSAPAPFSLSAAESAAAPAPVAPSPRATAKLTPAVPAVVADQLKDGLLRNDFIIDPQKPLPEIDLGNPFPSVNVDAIDKIDTMEIDSIDKAPLDLQATQTQPLVEDLSDGRSEPQQDRLTSVEEPKVTAAPAKEGKRQLCSVPVIDAHSTKPLSDRSVLGTKGRNMLPISIVHNVETGQVSISLFETDSAKRDTVNQSGGLDASELRPRSVSDLGTQPVASPELVKRVGPQIVKQAESDPTLNGLSAPGTQAPAREIPVEDLTAVEVRSEGEAVEVACTVRQDAPTSMLQEMLYDLGNEEVAPLRNGNDSRPTEVVTLDGDDEPEQAQSPPAKRPRRNRASAFDNNDRRRREQRRARIRSAVVETMQEAPERKGRAERASTPMANGHRRQTRQSSGKQTRYSRRLRKSAPIVDSSDEGEPFVSRQEDEDFDITGECGDAVEVSRVNRTPSTVRQSLAAGSPPRVVQESRTRLMRPINTLSKPDRATNLTEQTKRISPPQGVEHAAEIEAEMPIPGRGIQQSAGEPRQLWNREIDAVEKMLARNKTGSPSCSSSEDGGFDEALGETLAIVGRLMKPIREGKKCLMDIDNLDEHGEMMEFYRDTRNHPPYALGTRSPGAVFVLEKGTGRTGVATTQLFAGVAEEHLGGEGLGALVPEMAPMSVAPVPESAPLMGSAPENQAAPGVHSGPADKLGAPSILGAQASSGSKESSEISSARSESSEEAEDETYRAGSRRGQGKSKAARARELQRRVCGDVLRGMSAESKRRVLRWAEKDFSWFDEGADMMEIVATKVRIPCTECVKIDAGPERSCEESILLKLWTNLSWRKVRRMRHLGRGGGLPSLQ